MVSTFNDLTQMGGTLQGNSLLRNLESSLVTTLGRTFEGSGEFRTMFDLGLEVERNGLIKILPICLLESVELQKLLTS